MKTVLAKSAVENATVLIMVGVTRWQVNVTVTLAGWGTGVISYVHREGLGLPVFTLVYVRTTGHVTQWAVVAAACQGSTDRVVNSVSHISTKLALFIRIDKLLFWIKYSLNSGACILNTVFFVGCPEGTHGLYCRETCSCKNGAKCNPANGQCKCKPGYHGDNCQHSESHVALATI